MSDKSDNHPSLLQKAAPALGALGAGALAYKHLRTPNFSAVPALKKVQQQAVEHGFHRIVEVAPHEAVDKAAPFAEKMLSHLKPHHDPVSGNMNAWNRLKFWAQEGGEAIPVRSTPEGNVNLINRSTPIKTKGVVANRNVQLDGTNQTPAHLVQGGSDIEGSAHTQKALTQLAAKGKWHEANLLNKHAPGSAPETLSALDVGSPQSLEDLRQNFQQRFGDKPFLLKPTQGLASGGNFPYSDQDWAKHHEKYKSFISDPKKLQALHDAEQTGGGELAEFLGDHDILPGRTLHDALTNPKSVIGQELIQNPLGEYRVHSIAGAAPKLQMIPRWPQGAMDATKDTAKLMSGRLQDSAGVTGNQLQDFVQETISKLPQKYRDGTFGVDVMPFKKPDGSTGFKIIELNPSEAAGIQGSSGGGSGLLDSKYVPYAGLAHYRTATGRHASPIALGAGAAAAGLGYGGIRALRKPSVDE